MSSEFGEDQRRALAIDIQQEIMNDAATIFFGYEVTYLYFDKILDGVTMFPIDYYWLTPQVALAN
jgi:peptide/nickel transport system substrate-binding protein